MKVHFISIGGSAMHNLAIALKQKGFQVSGSDDEIFDPARSHLKQWGLLPENEGWFPEKITPDLDAVVLGMHAHADNPELLRAQQLNLTIYSYPEYLYQQSKDKLRLVVGGSHGKTTTTAMILSVLQSVNRKFDYMVGAQLKGFDVMVKLSPDADVMVIEGDEYLTSPLDPRPKFHLYHPHIAILTGIEWDHINVFPTFENYCSQFETFINLIEPEGSLIYCADDAVVCEVVARSQRSDINFIPYHTPQHVVRDGVTYISSDSDPLAIPIKVFGIHNLQNLTAARLACNRMGISDQSFYQAIQLFEGAGKRLECLFADHRSLLFKDFAHAPSKVRATIAAVRQQYPNHNIIACLELHTYSSLNANFLPQYAHTMDLADFPLVYFNPHAIQLKRLPQLNLADIVNAFDDDRLMVSNHSDGFQKLINHAVAQSRRADKPCCLLMMSSGNFDNLNFDNLINILNQQ